jgi:hypothetical protein
MDGHRFYLQLERSLAGMQHKINPYLKIIHSPGGKGETYHWCRKLHYSNLFLVRGNRWDIFLPARNEKRVGPVKLPDRKSTLIQAFRYVPA